VPGLNTVMYRILQCEILSSYSSAAEGTSRPRGDAVLLSE
jgi:hypothetical protein